MVGKKGFLRIAEAVVAVLIVLSALLILNYKSPARESKDLSENMKIILDEVARNSSLRGRILIEGDNPDLILDIENFSIGRLDNPSVEIKASICEIDSLSCSIDDAPKDRDIFSIERIVSVLPETTDFSPRRVKIFWWYK